MALVFHSISIETKHSCLNAAIAANAAAARGSGGKAVGRPASQRDLLLLQGERKSSNSSGPYILEGRLATPV